MAAGVNAAADAAPALELQLLRLDFRPWTAADSLAMQKLLSFGLSTNWERELLRADLARELGRAGRQAGPHLSRGERGSADAGIPARRAGTELAERVDSIRRFLGMTVEATGSNNWAVAPSRSASGGALIMRRPAPLAHDAGHHLPARASAGRPLLPRRLAAGQRRVAPSATTTTWRGRSRTRWATSWTCSSSGSTASATCSRTSGATCIFDEQIEVRGRPGRAAGARDAPRADRERGAARRRLRAARARVDVALGAGDLAGQHRRP